MIVKNETAVLGRLFASLKQVIDYYVIVDTGSTDGTPDFIKAEMARYGIDGQVYEHEWVNFGFNRNQALQYVYQIGYQGWVLFIDADEELGCSNPDFYKALRPGVSYQLEKHHNELRYRLPNLVDVSQTKWQWQGVVHEYLEHISGPEQLQPLSEAWIIYHSGEGARSQGVSVEQKFLRDAALLEAECQRQPNDARSRFYLAQSYHHAEHYEQGYQHYQLRAKMPGWVQETFVAQLRVGRLAVLLQKPDSEILQAYTTAFSMRPTRAEPLHDLAAWYRLRGAYTEAYQYAKQASLLPYPEDTLFVDKDIYDWRILDELAVAAYWVGQYAESKTASETLLTRINSGILKLDAHTGQRLRDNLGYAEAKLAENPTNASTIKEQDSTQYSELLLGAGSRVAKDVLLPGMPATFNNLTRLDNNPDHRPDVVWDLTKHPLPFADNSFNEIHAYEVLEHLAQQGDYRFFFAEFSEYWRILKPNGLFLASVPDRLSKWAWGDPSHTRIIQAENLVFLDQDEYAAQVGVTTMSDFRYLYKAHFKTIFMQIRGESLCFALRAIKP